MKKILITGSAGFLGKNLYKTLSEDYEVLGTDIKDSLYTSRKVDLSLFEDVREMLRTEAPEMIIHCAAISNVDFCETNHAEADRNNIIPTRILAEWSEKNGAKLVYISSDYVYSGETGNYNEMSKVSPINYYGRTKVDSEEIVSKLDNCLILRPTVLFGWDDGLNFFMQMTRIKEKRKIPYDQISNPTDINVIVKYISEAIRQDISGTFVATGREEISRYDFALKIANYFGIDKRLLISASTSELGQKARRPLNNNTDSSLIRKTLGYEPPSLDDSLRAKLN